MSKSPPPPTPKPPDPIPIEDPNTARAEQAMAIQGRQSAASSVNNDLEGGSAEGEQSLRRNGGLGGGGGFLKKVANFIRQGGDRSNSSVLTG